MHIHYLHPGRSYRDHCASCEEIALRNGLILLFLFGEVGLRDHLGGVPWDKLLVATRGQEAHRDRTDELSYMLVDRTPIGEEATIPCIA